MNDILGNQTNITIARMLDVLRVTHLDGKTYYDGEDYINDLNAMHRAEQLAHKKYSHWVETWLPAIASVISNSQTDDYLCVGKWELITATAYQRALAFIYATEKIRSITQ